MSELEARESEQEAKAPEAPGFFIAGIGASAGGLEAITELLKQMPAEPSLALVIVQHLDPEHESLLVELLAASVRPPVLWAVHGEALRPGRIYVAPAKSLLSLTGGILFLTEDGRHSGSGIDHFFRSLAADARDWSIAVVLSGSGRDGAAGLEAVKSAGGFTFVQEEKTAAFPQMPQAAVSSNCADRVLPPGAIGQELARMTQASRVLLDQSPAGDEAGPAAPAELDAIFRLLALRTGVQFAEYKQSTIKRRVARRMALVKITELPEYLKLLQRSREEIEELYESLLINVTEFFRDPESFDYVRANILPALRDEQPDNTPLRIWIPGCSTGEEAYSMGIAVREIIEQRGRTLPVQIFATDVSNRAIAIARAGLYPESKVRNVSAERLKRDFIKMETGYAIQKHIRDMCIFARQNVVGDSPFSRLDLISCRNLLIYLGPKLQKALMPIFHYALRPGGRLVLGTSESVGGHGELFRLLDRRFRIYARLNTSRPRHFEMPVPQASPEMIKPLRTMNPTLRDAGDPFDILGEADRIVLRRYGPNGVLVNDELEILQFRGDVSPYLSQPEGHASLNLVKLAQDGLAVELQAALREARERNTRVEKERIAVMRGNEAREISLDVTPIEDAQSRDRFFMVLFRENEPEPRGRSRKKGLKSAELAQIEQLRHDLRATRNYLQASIEKHETTNQELRAASEAIQSSNEELQSTNEELETAKEELQSTNEELTTVNDELHSRQLELMHLNNDLNNLINSVQLPIIILDQDMRIRRFTPMTEKVLNVIPTDIGRPLSDLKMNLEIEDLPRLLAEVMESLTLRELEVRVTGGRWHSMRLRPYRTSENKIDGVVMTLIDIDDLKRTIGQLEAARDFAQAVLESMHDAMAALDGQLRVSSPNRAFCETFGTSPARCEERPLADLLGMGEEQEGLRQDLERLLAGGAPLVGREFRPSGPRALDLMVNARKVAKDPGASPVLIVSFRKMK